MKFKWIFGFLNVPAAFFIIIYSYLHFSLWYGISFFENEPTEVFDFIVGKFFVFFIFNAMLEACVLRISLLSSLAISLFILSASTYHKASIVW